MDKKKLFGIMILSMMLILYTHFFDSRPPTPQQTTTVEKSPPTPIPPISEIFTPHQHGITQEAILENDVLRIVLTNRGGNIKSVILKSYLDHQGEPLALIDEKSSNMEFQFSSAQCPINTGELFFELIDNNDQVIDQAHAFDKQVTFILTVGINQYIRQTFTLPKKGYSLLQEWEFIGLGGKIDQNKIEFNWHNHIKRAEKDIEACRNKTTVNYYLTTNVFKNLKEQSNKPEEEKIENPIQWMAIKQRFFTAAIAAQTIDFPSGYCTLKPSSHPQTTVKEAHLKINLPQAIGDHKGAFKFYFGPNTYQDLKNFAPGFSKNLPLGWPVVKWINQYIIIPIFDWIAKYVHNYGIVILLLVTFIKLLLLPLSYKSYIAMAEMKIVKPALESLKQKYGKDTQQAQLEQVKLYREMGINPLSGCIPVLLQMPILLAMFNFFPNAIELRQQPFLWASDLSTYDAIINLPFNIPFYGSHISLFTLLMTASTILYTWSSNQVNMPEGPMKTMSYLFPITFMFILNSFPAGLSFYYFVSNLITFGQQILIKRFVDEDKLKEKLAKNKDKIINKDVSFKQRLQSAVKNATLKQRIDK